MATIIIFITRSEVNSSNPLNPLEIIVVAWIECPFLSTFVNFYRCHPLSPLHLIPLTLKSNISTIQTGLYFLLCLCGLELRFKWTTADDAKDGRKSIPGGGNNQFNRANNHKNKFRNENNLRVSYDWVRSRSLLIGIYVWWLPPSHFK